MIDTSGAPHDGRGFGEAQVPRTAHRLWVSLPDAG